MGDKLKGCPCWAVQNQAPGFFKTKDDLIAVQKALLGLNDLPDNPPPPDDGGDVPPAHCELRKRDGNGLYVQVRLFLFCLLTRHSVNVETPFFSSLVKTLCKDYPGDIASNFDKSLTSKDAADDQWKNQFTDLTVQFIWEDKPGTCDPIKCEQIYNQFIGGSCMSISPFLKAFPPFANQTTRLRRSSRHA